MNYLSGYTAKFDAGHRYTVKVWWTREGLAAADAQAWIDTRNAIDALIGELRNRELAKMLGPHDPSAAGIADFLMGRLTINFPVTRIDVHESDGPTFILERDSDL